MSLSDVCSANPLNPSQQRRSKSPRRVLQFLPAVTARNSCGGRCRRTEPPCVMLSFLSSSCVKTVRRRGSGCRVCHDWSREAELSSSVDRPLCRPADCRYSRGDQGIFNRSQSEKPEAWNPFGTTFFYTNRGWLNSFGSLLINLMCMLFFFLKMTLLGY